MTEFESPEALIRQYDELEKKFMGGNGGKGPPVDPPALPGDNEPMEARIAKLEDFAQDTRERLVRIETRLDQTATKGDLAEGISSMVKWVVGTGVGLGVAGITVMTFVLNNAAPKVSATATPPAIIINVPASAPPATPQGK